MVRSGFRERGRPKGSDRLAPHLPTLRERLVRQRAFRVEQLAEHGRVPARVGRSAVDEVNAHVAAAARRALADIDRALAALADGRYGDCERCRAPIPSPVLLAIPQARLCMDCHAAGAP